MTHQTGIAQEDGVIEVIGGIRFCTDERMERHRRAYEARERRLKAALFTRRLSLVTQAPLAIATPPRRAPRARDARRAHTSRPAAKSAAGDGEGPPEPPPIGDDVAAEWSGRVLTYLGASACLEAIDGRFEWARAGLAMVFLNGWGASS